jgi:hypothetical protein
MMNNFPEPYHPLAIVLFLSYNDVEPKPPKVPRKRWVKEAIQWAIRNLGTLLVKLGHRMEQVGRASHEFVVP